MATGLIAADLAPLGDNLLWVAHYDNATQQVLVYDPSGSFKPDGLALPPGVSVENPDSPPVLARLISRRIYWVAVNQEQTAVLGGTTRNLAAGVNTLVW